MSKKPNPIEHLAADENMHASNRKNQTGKSGKLLQWHHRNSNRAAKNYDQPKNTLLTKSD
jgi:hypothetical protein